MKIKLIAVIQTELSGYNNDYYDDYNSLFNTILSDFKSIEVNEVELEELTQVVSHYNINKKHGSPMVAIIKEFDDDDIKLLFEDYKKFKEKEEKKRKAIELKAAEEKKKRDEKAIERKRKQLEKLKQELEPE